jgi:hypothetical protein
MRTAQFPCKPRVQPRQFQFALLQRHPLQIFAQSHLTTPFHSTGFANSANSLFPANSAYFATVSRTIVPCSTRNPVGGDCAVTAPGFTGSLGCASPLPTGATGTSTEFVSGLQECPPVPIPPARSPPAIQPARASQTIRRIVARARPPADSTLGRAMPCACAGGSCASTVPSAALP